MSPPSKGGGRREEVLSILDFILNRANQGEIDAIIAALERRKSTRMLGSGEGSLNMQAYAADMSAGLASQVSYSIDSVRDMVNGFVRDMVRKEAPHIGDAELDVLLESWGATENGERKQEKARLPAESLLAMARDFVDYSNNAMGATKMAELREQMGDWQKKYWESFPPDLRTLVGAYLQGKIEAEVFWNAAMSVLGL